MILKNRFRAIPKLPSNFELLAPLAAAEFAAAWQMDVEVENRPALEVLKPLMEDLKLMEDLGLNRRQQTTFSPIVEKALARPVSLRMRKVSRFQIVEEVCRQIGLDVKYNPRLFRRPFVEEESVRPVCLQGPFALELTAVTENQRDAAGTLDLSLRMTKLPPKLAALFDLLPVYLSDLKVVGPHGEDLFNENKSLRVQPVKGFWGPAHGPRFLRSP